MDQDAFCTGKRPFRSYKQASAAASKTAHRSGAQFHPYRCTKCGMYHYGRADGRVASKLREKRHNKSNYYEGTEE